MADRNGQRFTSPARRRIHDAEHYLEPRSGAIGLANAHDAERRTDGARGHVSDGAGARRQEGSGTAEGHRGAGGVEHPYVRRHESANEAVCAGGSSAELSCGGGGGGGGGGGLADDDDDDDDGRRDRIEALDEQAGRRQSADRSSVGGVADDDAGLEGRDTREVGFERQTIERSGETRRVGVPLQGFAISDGSGGAWVLCNDPDAPKWRPVEPGAFPLAHGAPARVGRLRGYGNAINAKVAKIFIEETEAALTTLRI